MSTPYRSSSVHICSTLLGPVNASGASGAGPLHREPMPKQPPKHNWIVKRAYKRAVRRAQLHGSTSYRGRTHNAQTLCSLVVTPQQTPLTKASTRRPMLFQHDPCIVTYNIGGAAGSLYDELRIWMEEVQPSILFLQESHWKQSSTFENGSFHVISSAGGGSHAGVITFVNKRIADADSICFNELVPGRLLHVRIFCKSQTWDTFNVYQVPWKRQRAESTNKARRPVWSALDKAVAACPLRNKLVIGGDFNTAMPLSALVTGPNFYKPNRAETDAHRFLQIAESHCLITLNTCSGPDMTFQGPQGSSVTISSPAAHKPRAEASRHAPSTARWASTEAAAYTNQSLCTSPSGCGNTEAPHPPHRLGVKV